MGLRTGIAHQFFAGLRGDSCSPSVADADAAIADQFFFAGLRAGVFGFPAAGADADAATAAIFFRPSSSALRRPGGTRRGTRTAQFGSFANTFLKSGSASSCLPALKSETACQKTSSGTSAALGQSIAEKSSPASANL